jgi:hypothetical protein
MPPAPRPRFIQYDWFHKYSLSTRARACTCTIAIYDRYHAHERACAYSMPGYQFTRSHASTSRLKKSRDTSRLPIASGSRTKMGCMILLTLSHNIREARPKSCWQPVVPSIPTGTCTKTHQFPYLRIKSFTIRFVLPLHCCRYQQHVTNKEVAKILAQFRIGDLKHDPRAAAAADLTVQPSSLFVFIIMCILA